MNLESLKSKYQDYVDNHLQHYNCTNYSELVNEIRGGIDTAITKAENPAYILISKLAYCVLTLHLWETNQLDKDALPTYYITNYLPTVKILIDEYGLLKHKEDIVILRHLKDTRLWELDNINNV